MCATKVPNCNYFLSENAEYFLSQKQPITTTTTSSNNRLHLVLFAAALFALPAVTVLADKTEFNLLQYIELS